MVMDKLGLPRVSQEELGHHLGLTVPPADEHLFWNVRVSDTPPSDAGYGTQIQKPEFNPNAAFEKLHIPLLFTYNPIDNFELAENARTYLQEVERTDADSIVCFRYGTLYGTQSTNGHASVFDRYLPETDEVRLIDPAASKPKWRVSLLRSFSGR